MRMPASHLGTAVRVDGAPSATAFVCWQPCLGLLPIAIASPARYLVPQLLAGLVSLLTLLLAEGVR
jgi:hypothetical protein